MLTHLTCLTLSLNVADVQELELKVDVQSLDKLLDFLSCSFMGGTDVDKPLYLSLQRLQKQEWAQVRRKRRSRADDKLRARGHPKGEGVNPRGTDVDKLMYLSLQRLQKQEWAEARNGCSGAG